MIGVAAGLGAMTFQLLSQVIIHFTLSGIAGFAPRKPRASITSSRTWPPNCPCSGLMVVITAGGLVSGFLVYTYAPEAEGHGTDAAIDSFHNKRGLIRGRIPIIKTLASAITIGTGGSGGREGPIAQIGAGFGSFLATKLNLSARDRRIMLAAGMGAGVGAIFRAPLAGALFAGEILYRDADLESDVIVPAAIASIVGYSVYGLSLPSDIWFSPLLGNQLKYTLGSPLELFSYGGVVAGAGGRGGDLYQGVLRRSTGCLRNCRSRRISAPPLERPSPVCAASRFIWRWTANRTPWRCSPRATVRCNRR